MMNSSKTQSYWVKLPCLFFIAAAMAITMGIILAPFLHLSRKAMLISPGRLINQNRVWLEESNNQVVLNLPVVEEPPFEQEPSTSDYKEGNEDETDSADLKSDESAAETTDSDVNLLELPSEQEDDKEDVAENQCNIFQGEWVSDHSEPLYRKETCPFLSDNQNCPGNGRPDTGYINWKWKPRDCELPKLDGLAFLELMRGKTLGFIGDSVSRNQYEALMCTLVQVAEPKGTGNKKFQRWFFREYNVKVVRIWSSWLVRHTLDAIDFAPENLTKLHLDTLDDKINDHLPMFDVVVVASGHWWPKTAAYIVDGKVVGGQSWWNDMYKKQHDVLSGYGMAMKTALKAILSHPEYKGLTILRTYSPEHYKGGAWNTGGSCTGKTEPLRESELPQNTYINSMYAHQMAAVKDAEQIGDNAKRLRVMDITRPFSYRADGHPGPYRNKDPNKKVERGPDGKPPPQDCLHWCMPGPIDTWNEYLFEMLKREYEQ